MQTETTQTNVVMPEAWNEIELRDRMVAKSPVAWKEFHRRYDRLVYRCIHKVTCRFHNVVGSEDVREIYAQLLVSLTARDMHKLRTFDAALGNKLSSWIGLLATNAAWDHLRTIARQPQTAALADAEDVRASTPDACDQMMAEQRWSLVNRTLEAFSSKDRQFVRLFYVDGLTPEEIADEMSISIKTVYSKKHKIRCRLERLLTPCLDVAA